MSIDFNETIEVIIDGMKTEIKVKGNVANGDISITEYDYCDLDLQTAMDYNIEISNQVYNFLNRKYYENSKLKEHVQYVDDQLSLLEVMLEPYVKWNSSSVIFDSFDNKN